MMICPSCQSEYRDGFHRCASCDCELVAPASSPVMVMSQKASAKDLLKDVSQTSIVEAGLEACREIERELLGADIPAFVSSSDVEEGALGSAGITRFSVIVGTDDLGRASDTLKGRFEALVASEGIGSLNVDAINLENETVMCPACGHEGALQAGLCADCGLFLGAPE